MSDATFTDGDLAVVRGLIKHWNEWGAPEYGKVRTTLRYATGEIEETYCELAIALNKLLAEREAQVRAEEREKVLLERMTIHTFNTMQLPDGRFVVIHPEIPPHVWNGNEFEPIEIAAATYNDNRKG
jgi:hypothetical protein